MNEVSVHDLIAPHLDVVRMPFVAPAPAGSVERWVHASVIYGEW
jgi:hypothetical protein